MTIRNMIVKIVHQEDLNFLLTNRLPRRLATRFVGWFSKIEQPLIRDEFALSATAVGLLSSIPPALFAIAALAGSR